MKSRIVFPTRQSSSAPVSPGVETSRLVTSQRFWRFSLLTFARQEKSPARLTSFADRWQNNIGCWLLPLFAFTPQPFRDHGRCCIFDNFEFGAMSLGLVTIIAGCLVTVVRRLGLIARALKGAPRPGRGCLGSVTRSTIA